MIFKLKNIIQYFKKKNQICKKCDKSISSKQYCEYCGCKIYKVFNFEKINKICNMVLSHHYDSQEINENLAYISDIGRRHKENQDSGMVKIFNNWIFLGISDGVSRSNSPKLASSTALEESYKYLSNVVLTENNALIEIKNAIQIANQKIIEIKLEKVNPSLDPPEATIVIALVNNNKAFIGWVGDSRAYVMEKNKAKLVTRDDSWVMYAIDNGMSLKEANASPMAHAITQCMGMKETAIIPHILTIDLTNKSLMLCSDGLWNYFDDESLIAQLYNSTKGSAKEIALNLVKAANLEGGHDNISVAICKNDLDFTKK